MNMFIGVLVGMLIGSGITLDTLETVWNKTATCERYLEKTVVTHATKTVTKECILYRIK